ncbi:MAG: TonB-dependent receptor [Rhodocyclaceae bacterium]|nr:TonB-dependent receptor [Rhodocyclaceae bacterium]
MRRQPLAVAVVLALAACPPVSAAADRTAPAEADSTTELPAVTVTARRGSEQAKDVPFAITTISGEQLERRRLLNLEETLRRTPGVVVENFEGDVSSTIRIRGVGTLYHTGPDSNFVGFTVDGVSMSGRDISIGTLDIDQIEVLKGPQGTVFGRTSEAGTVNVVSRRPGREREGHVRAEIGEEGQHLQEAAVGGPLSESLSGRFAIRRSGYDHWIDNRHTGKPEVEPRELAFRGSLRWDIGARTSALLIAERQKSRHKPVMQVMMPYKDHPALDVRPGLMDGNFRSHERYSLELDHDLANSRLTSITSLVKVDMETTSVYDRAYYRALMGIDMESSLTGGVKGETTTSQELRWQSLPGAAVFWTSGLYFMDSDSGTYVDAGPWYPKADNDLSQRSHALFGEITYPVAERWKLTGGLRHSWDRKRVAYHAVAQRAALQDDYTTGRVALSYALNAATNLYGVLSRGHTSGGFKNFTTGMTGSSYDTTPTKASSTLSGEIGFKTELPARGLALNGALFVNETRDNHLWGFDPLTNGALIFNADTRSRGLELEGNWRLHPRFRLSAGLTHTRAEVAKTVAGVYGGDVAAGNRIKDVPRWSGHLGAEYHHPLPAFAGLHNPRLNLQATYSYIGTRPADPQNNFDLKAYGKLDLRAGIQGRNLELYAWADNLLDEGYDLFAYQYTPSVRVGVPGRGRTLGVGFNWFF